MQLTLTEQEYLQCLAESMTFEQMADALGWTVEEVEDFGDEVLRPRVRNQKAHSFPKRAS